MSLRSVRQYWNEHVQGNCVSATRPQNSLLSIAVHTRSASCRLSNPNQSSGGSGPVGCSEADL
ncbi:hypothetical protein XFF6166_610009 [Xanthomonas citri pv. fuscans]|nr:hypothetical protein XFF6166_610009 [Xanthomonas citri pv. fuscans]SON98287.1 hypothetical protein XFF7767_1000117 [Xanthomonas citri pv. fuscans]SON99497.1 hypothetical protein XFF6960_170144 [Xanthomonas citri pv. fuscans]SOO11838.1 hypothetical protein XFF6970_960137 [Xanthomonas citri pv. fuscans]SOO12639.1 hypothetical protein XFF7766_1120119 [Xanthomonas citri pv. fuscans]